MNIADNSVRHNSNLRISDYDYFVALDWSQDTACGLAIMRSNQSIPRKKLVSPDMKTIKKELRNLRGRILLTIEELTPTQWLYCELRESVSSILICDPYRNHLLKDGPKTDKIDAGKLCLLLRGGLLKPVYHSADKLYELRLLEHSYHQYTKSSTRLKNQRAAFLRSFGQPKRGKIPLSHYQELYGFILDKKEQALMGTESIIKEYRDLFKQLSREIPILRKLMEIKGIGLVFAVTILGEVIDSKRFKDKYKYWGYCGLARTLRQSGKSHYWKKPSNYNHLLKWVYKTAALVAINGHQNDMREYYDVQLSRGISPENARNAVARYIAKASWAMMKNNSSYHPYHWRSMAN